MENPATSYLWQLPEAKALLEMIGAIDVVFTACMFGGIRPKRVRIRTNIDEHSVNRKMHSQAILLYGSWLRSWADTLIARSISLALVGQI